MPVDSARPFFSGHFSSAFVVPDENRRSHSACRIQYRAAVGSVAVVETPMGWAPTTVWPKRNRPLDRATRLLVE
jgi:hypothetical protein